MTTKTETQPEPIVKTEIAEYSETAAALATLREEYAGVIFPVDTTEGMTAAKAARRRLRDYRVGLDKMRKRLGEEARDHLKRLNGDAKLITAELVSLEDPIDGQIKEEEGRKEREREAAIEAEEKRVRTIRERIDAIRAVPTSLPFPPTAEQVRGAQTRLEALAVGFDFEEFADEAAEAAAAAKAKLGDTLTAAEKHQAEQAELDELRRKNAEREAEEARQREAEAAERERVEMAKAEINGRYMDPVMSGQTHSPEEIEARIEEVEDDVPIVEIFGDELDYAERVRKGVLYELGKALETARQRVAEEAERAEEAAELEKLRQADKKRKADQAAADRKRAELAANAEREKFPGTEPLLERLMMDYSISRDIAVSWIARAADDLDVQGEIFTAGKGS